MVVSRGLAGPEAALNQRPPKGNPVNIPEPPRYQRQRRPVSRRLGADRVGPSPHPTAEVRGVPPWREPEEGGMGLPLGGFGSSPGPVKRETGKGTLGDRT